MSLSVGRNASAAGFGTGEQMRSGTRSVVLYFNVEWAVEKNDKQARPVLGCLVAHRLSGWEVRVGAGANLLTIGLEVSFQDNDRVRGSVPVSPSFQTGRITNKIMLLAGCRILIQHSESNGLVVHGGGGRARFLHLE